MHSLKSFLILLLAAVIFTVPVSAAERTIDPAAQFCFSSDDFLTADTEQGIFLTGVPQKSVAVVCYNGRILRAGDALPASALNELTLDTRCVTQQDTAITYCTVSNGNASQTKQLKLSILPKKNDPPAAMNGKLETYRNIAVNGSLDASDPENGALTYQITAEPKRGTVELYEDGNFTYTPHENKVGKDKFTFVVTDDAGQTSEPAVISIEIKKPSDKQVYADMQNDPDAFTAMWMKEESLYSGMTVGDHLCFSPDTAVTRGEFLVMTMKLVGAEPNRTNMHSGFADEAITPLWMQPYIVSALSNGMIRGTEYESGLEFRPEADLTHAEAAVMLQNILQLPVSNAQPVSAFEDTEMLPVWAAKSAAALTAAGIEMNMTSGNETVCRRDAAKLLYQVSKLLQDEAMPTFYWAQ